MLSACGAASFAAAQDEVTIAAEQGEGQFRVKGTIVEFTGTAIRLRSDSGAEHTYPAERVLDIATQWTADHQAARAARDAGQFARAVEQYRRAVNQETRTWARRTILAELVWCYRALGQLDAAGEAFLLLVSSDPATRDFDSIPLAWTATEGVSPQRAREWLARADSPAARLLGASYLMTTERAAALAALAELSGHEDARIAALAEAQAWRAVAFRAEPAQTALWQQKIETMPESLRGGPYFVLGQALAAQKQHDAAALTLLRVPILHGRDRQLAAAALVLAGAALAEAAQPDEARRLFQEVCDRYPPSRWQSEAQSRLKQLDPQ